MKKRCYISGPMSNIINYNQYEFNKAQEYLEEFHDFDVVNPVSVSQLCGGCSAVARSYECAQRLLQTPTPYTDITDRQADEKAARLYRSCMDADLALIRGCDCIFMLRGWENSVGAKRELVEAINNGLEVILQKEEEAK